MPKKFKSKDPTNEESKEPMDPDDTFVIENTEPRAIILPPFEKGKTKEEKDGQTLFPGENGVRVEVWKAFENNPAIKKFIGVGFLENRGIGKARPILETLDAFSVGEARKQIGKELDPKQLDRWIKGTSNEHLVQACIERKAKVDKK